MKPRGLGTSERKYAVKCLGSGGGGGGGGRGKLKRVFLGGVKCWSAGGRHRKC